MWSRGGVVIVKRGDEAITDAIEQGMDILVSDTTDEDTKKIKDERDLLKKAKTDAILCKIAKAEYEYGRNPTLPDWARKISEAAALVVYVICTFIDRYLRIK